MNSILRLNYAQFWLWKMVQLVDNRGIFYLENKSVNLPTTRFFFFLWCNLTLVKGLVEIFNQSRKARILCRFLFPFRCLFSCTRFLLNSCFEQFIITREKYSVLIFDDLANIISSIVFSTGRVCSLLISKKKPSIIISDKASAWKCLHLVLLIEVRRANLVRRKILLDMRIQPKNYTRKMQVQDNRSRREDRVSLVIRKQEANPKLGKIVPPILGRKQFMKVTFVNLKTRSIR